MLDGLEIERRGKPAVVVCTEPFVHSAREIARSAGMADYPFVTVRHPFGSATPDELQARAEAALPQMLEILRR